MWRIIWDGFDLASRLFLFSKRILRITYLHSESGAEYAVDEAIDGAVEDEEEVRRVGENVNPEGKRLLSGLPADLDRR